MDETKSAASASSARSASTWRAHSCAPEKSTFQHSSARTTTQVTGRGRSGVRALPVQYARALQSSAGTAFQVQALECTRVQVLRFKCRALECAAHLAGRTGRSHRPVGPAGRTGRFEVLALDCMHCRGSACSRVR